MAFEDLKTLALFLVAVMPTIIWLWFWLQEDAVHPEPKTPIVITYFAGALCALLVIPLESFASKLFVSSIVLVIAIAAIEEIVKLGIVALINFRANYMDEAIDYAVYLISGAMGFAMMENVLFFISSIFKQELSFIFFTTNIRFLGATVLHGVMAAILGIIIGYAHYSPKIPLHRESLTILGLILVIGLHALFNYFIMNGSNTILVLVLGGLWLIGIVVLYLFERTRHRKHKFN